MSGLSFSPGKKEKKRGENYNKYLGWERRVISFCKRLIISVLQGCKNRMPVKKQMDRHPMKIS